MYAKESPTQNLIGLLIECMWQIGNNNSYILHAKMFSCMSHICPCVSLTTIAVNILEMHYK